MSRKTVLISRRKYLVPQRELFMSPRTLLISRRTYLVPRIEGSYLSKKPSEEKFSYENCEDAVTHESFCNMRFNLVQKEVLTILIQAA